MIVVVSEETVIPVFWVVAILVSLVRGMKSDGQRQQQGGVPRSGRSNGFIPSSFRAISSYLRIVSSGASTVARSAASVASSIVERDDDTNHDQVIWAGFDKLYFEGELSRKVLLLGYRSGFQVWDVQDADDVCNLVSIHCGPVSFMQMLPKPLASKISDNKFADCRPLLAVCMDGSRSGTSSQNGNISNNGGASNCHDQGNGNVMPTIVQFYSLRSQSYVHVLKFRSVIFSVRCSSRVVAISQATQIHCFDVTTLERVYTIITNPISVGCPGSGGISYGPLAVGPRWLAYSGSPVVVSNPGRVSPQHLTPSASFPGFSSNGSLVAHYAKESSKQLAAGIVTLGDMGYKKLSRYCSELLPDNNNNNNSLQIGNPVLKANGAINGHSIDNDSVGMVIVRDIISKTVIAQFKAHKSPISALCFDPSGTLLVTASVKGHNINVYKIMPGYSGSSSSSDAGPSYIHLYRLQRGLTNAVIQDISFSDDSNWIIISSSRGTSHLFAINLCGGLVNIQSDDGNLTPKSNGFGVMTKSTVRWPPNSATQVSCQQSLIAAGPPLTLAALSRIRNGSNGWKGSVTGAAAAATGRASPSFGAIASCFHNCRGDPFFVDSKAKYHMLVFSPTGFMIQYVLSISNDLDARVVSELAPAYESASDNDARLVVEAIQKWAICQRSNRRERDDTIDIYGDHGISDNGKIYPEEMEKGNSISSGTRKTAMKASPSSEEKLHLYISEAELQMHQARTPLWAKPEIYFQSMVEGFETDDGTALEGELEIERIPTCTIEARSRDLVPVFDYAQTSKIQKTRASVLDSKNNAQLLHQNTWVSENGVLPRSSSMSSHCMQNFCDETSEFQSGFEGNGWYNRQVPLDRKDSVNTNDIPKPNTLLEIVNNRESLEAEALLKLVNNNIDGLEMENCSGDGSVEFD